MQVLTHKVLRPTFAFIDVGPDHLDASLLASWVIDDSIALVGEQGWNLAEHTEAEHWVALHWGFITFSVPE